MKAAIRMKSVIVLRYALLASVSLSWGAGALAQSDAEGKRPVKLEDVVVTGQAAKAAYEQHLLRFEVAERIAHACFDYARANDYAVSLHIIDQFGYPIYVGRMDGQQADNVETSGMKAETALYFREPTRVWMERSQENPLMPIWLSQMGQFAVAGGVPIIVEDQLVGAMGVGGGTSDQDEACAIHGLITVLGRQPALVDLK